MDNSHGPQLCPRKGFEMAFHVVTGRPGEWMDCRRCVTDEEHKAAVAAHDAQVAMKAAAQSRAGGRR